MNDNQITVRIAVGVDADGKWCAVGDSGSTDEATTAFLRQHSPITVAEIYFVEALVPDGVISGALVPYLATQDIVDA